MKPVEHKHISVEEFKEGVKVLGRFAIGGVLIFIGLVCAAASPMGGLVIASSALLLASQPVRFLENLASRSFKPPAITVTIILLVSAGFWVTSVDSENRKIRQKIAAQEQFIAEKSDFIAQIERAEFERDLPRAYALLSKHKDVEDVDLDRVRETYRELRTAELEEEIENGPRLTRNMFNAYRELSELNPDNAEMSGKFLFYQRAQSREQKLARDWAREVKEQARNEEEQKRNCKPDLFDGFVMSQVFVKKRLKSPRTAKFPVSTLDQTKYTGTCGEVLVRSYVDSQNSYGAMLRTHFTVVVKYHGGDKWTLVDIDLNN